MRFFTQVEIEFEVPDHVGVPKYQGDAPIDFANRALEHLRPALEALINGGGAHGYYITGPKRCACVALPQHGESHGDRCRDAVAGSEDCPVPTIRVTHFEVPPAEDEEGDDGDA